MTRGEWYGALGLVYGWSERECDDWLEKMKMDSTHGYPGMEYPERQRDPHAHKIQEAPAAWATKPADVNPYTPMGRTAELYEAMHRLVSAADDLEKYSAAYRVPSPPIHRNDPGEVGPVMSELAARIDNAVGNLNVLAYRLQAMADGFK